MTDSNHAPGETKSEEAMRLFALVESAPADLLGSAVFAASAAGYRDLRDLVLRDPVEVGLADPEQFLRVSRLRSEWIVRGWRQFFEKHEKCPLPIPESPSPEEAAKRVNFSVSIYPHERRKVMDIRRYLENATGRRVTESSVFRLCLRGKSPNDPDLLDLLRSVEEDDLRRRKKA